MNTQITQATPCKVDLEKGKKYFWCACGASKTQPYCDGSHKSLGSKTEKVLPLVFEAENTETRYLCACKRTGSPPFCDGSHKQPA